nr:hypothetical protein [Tanacetum cinerariifolium]
MIDVINLESSMTPLPCSGKKGKKKTQTGNIQPAVKGLAFTLDKGIRSSKPLPRGKPSDDKDPKGNKQPSSVGSPATHPDDGTRKSNPLAEGINIDPKDIKRNIQLTDRDHTSTLVTNLSGSTLSIRWIKPNPLDLRWMLKAGWWCQILGGGCPNMGGRCETRGGGDGFKGPDGQLSMVDDKSCGGSSWSSRFIGMTNQSFGGGAT